MKMTKLQIRQSLHSAVNIFWPYIIIISGLLLITGCSSTELTGTGSQSGNGRITCKVYNSDGTPAQGASVYLRSNNFVADTTGAGSGKSVRSKSNDYTDTNGVFFIDSIDTGNYFIEVNDGKSHAALLGCSVTESDSIVNLSGATLQPTGCIKGTFTSAPDDSVALYIQVLGLDRIAIRDTTAGEFLISDVPVGSYTLRMSASAAEYEPLEISNINMNNSDSADLGNIDFLPQNKWLNSRHIYINTTSSGAAVSGTVTGFPVVVRLNAGNFDFSKAKTNGSDLRFAKQDGTWLPYEIERWDAVNHLAEIWVNVDTIFGNDSLQHFIMYWGNDKAISRSNSTSVFDTSSGFAAVWHLSDNKETVIDATANHYNGTDLQIQTRANGNIAYGHYLESPEDCIEVTKMCNPGSEDFTVCAWIKQTVAMKRQTIISKSVGGGPVPYYGWLITLDEHGALQAFIATDSGSWGDPHTFSITSLDSITDTLDWHHVAVVINRSVSNNCRLYIDGRDVTKLPVSGDIAGLGSVENDLPLRIGSTTTGYSNWNGSIDECSFSLSARSADWISLSYMNQKENDRLVVLK